MKADWDKLAAKWNTPDGSVLIVDADCTGSAQALCGKEGVKGYPTIKYYLRAARKGLITKVGEILRLLTVMSAANLTLPAVTP